MSSGIVSATANQKFAVIASKPEVVVERRGDDVVIVRHPSELVLDERTLAEVLDTQANKFPARTFLTERTAAGWQSVSYSEAARRVDGIAASLLDRGIGHGDRFVIAAANGIEHALVMQALLSIGAVVAPLSPVLVERGDGAAALEIIRRIGAVGVVSDRTETAALADAAGLPHSIILGTHNRESPNKVGISMLPVGPEVAAAKAKVLPTDLAKILFTSGSSGAPKAVPYTHAMIAATQAMQLQVFPLGEEPGVMVDWLPWHHTFGGNVNLYATLWRADQLCIDHGVPLPGYFEETIESFKAFAPTFFSGVPASFEMLVHHLERDRAFAVTFFSRLTAMSSGGAALPVSLIDRLQAVARACGHLSIPFGSGYGMTETGGIAAFTYWQNDRSETLGLPPPGVEIKLVPIDEGERFEVRVRGPNVMSGYLDAPELNARSFDEEGFFITADALAWCDPDCAEAGLTFAGRLSEEFKLANGVFVRVAMLRTAVLSALSPLARDALIVGENRNEVGLLVWPSAAARDWDPLALKEELKRRLAGFNRDVGSATRRITRVGLLSSEPSLAAGELADKGSLNQAPSRRSRALEIEELYRDPSALLAAARS